MSTKKNPSAVQRDAEATRNKILDAAEVEFARAGLLGARTEAIAAGTGVTKAMLYYYFSDKEGLYQSVLERAFARRIQAIQKVDHSLPPEDALRAALESFLDEVGGNRNLPAIFFYEGIQNKGKYYGRIAIASLYQPLVDLLQKGMDSGVFRQLNPLHTAVNIIGSFVFYYCAAENVKHLWPAGADLYDPEMLNEHKRQAIDLVMHGVLKR